MGLFRFSVYRCSIVAALTIGCVSAACVSATRAVAQEQVPKQPEPEKIEPVANGSEAPAVEQAPAKALDNEDTKLAPGLEGDDTAQGAASEVGIRQEIGIRQSEADKLKYPNGALQFAFEGARWREVIKWLASEADLALHVDDLPTGSFTYTDPNTFTHQEAIDRVNLFLLPQGFTLVRSGKLLSVINLSDPRGMQQLDALAKLVAPEELADQPSYEIVKCIFPLGKLKADDAVTELQPLNLLTAPSVFSKTNQVMITDTVGRLTNVKRILDSFEPDTLDNGTIVKSFKLEHVSAEDILTVARPHLGLATGEMVGIDVSISSDLQGKFVFVTGIEDKVKLIENLIGEIDKPDKLSVTDGDAELHTYPVKGGNVDVVYNVLLTMMAGKSVRLSVDPQASGIVVLASPEDHKQISETVTQLQTVDNTTFRVINLKHVDPYFAVTLLEQMLDLEDPTATTTTRSSSGGYDRGRDYRDYRDYRDRDYRGGGQSAPTPIPKTPPKIDADPGNMRLFVRGTNEQIEQIEKIVEEIDVQQGSVVGGTSDIRVLPIKGKQAEEVLGIASKFWQGGNPIILLKSAVLSAPAETDREVNGKPKASTRPSVGIPSMRLLSDGNNAQETAIRCQITNRGLLLQSDDIEALDKFVVHLRTISGPMQSMPSPPIVFYLKHTKPEDAVRMLGELLDGADMAAENEAGSLVNGYVSSTSLLLGSFVSSREGVTTMMAGTMTVVADSRLNRLIAQGTAADIELIENYLKIIDKDSSITSIETYGTSHIIELAHVPAAEAAAVIREAFAGRVAAPTTSRQAAGQSQQGGQRPQPQREGSDERREGDEKRETSNKQPQRGQGGQAPRNLEPKMTIAVHESSNSLIVTAPEQMFLEVEKLVNLIDVRSKQTLTVIPTSNAGLLEMLLQDALNGTDSTGTGNSPKPSSSSPPTPSRGTPTRTPSRAPSSRELDALRSRLGK